MFRRHPQFDRLSASQTLTSSLTGALRGWKSVLNPVAYLKFFVKTYCKEEVTLAFLSDLALDEHLSLSSMQLVDQDSPGAVVLVAVFPPGGDLIEQFSRISSMNKDGWAVQALVLQKKGFCASAVLQGTVWELTVPSGSSCFPDWDVLVTACVELDLMPTIIMYVSAQRDIPEFYITEHLRQGLVQLQNSRGTDTDTTTLIGNIVYRKNIQLPNIEQAFGAREPVAMQDTPAVATLNTSSPVSREQALPATGNPPPALVQVGEPNPPSLHPINKPLPSNAGVTRQEEPQRPPPPMLTTVDDSLLSETFMPSAVSNPFLNESTSAHVTPSAHELQATTPTMQDDTFTAQNQHREFSGNPPQAVRPPRIQLFHQTTLPDSPEMVSTGFFMADGVQDPSALSEVPQGSNNQSFESVLHGLSDSLRKHLLFSEWRCSYCQASNVSYVYTCASCHKVDQNKRAQLIEFE